VIILGIYPSSLLSPMEETVNFFVEHMLNKGQSYLGQ